jgi:indolepyruvate ferredoxin oxidoreductase alpha subunit
VVGEDYGEGASVIQERTHAYALKSSMCLLDPRPDLGVMVRMVEEGFRLSETSQHAVLMELRIRACHVRGSFEAKDNLPPLVSTRALMDNPAGFDYMRLAHPPVTFRHEKLKGEQRIPAARRYIVEQKLNELMPGKHADVGIIVQGGLYNALIRSLQQLGLADAFGESAIPLLVLNVAWPAGAPSRWPSSASASAACWWWRKASPNTSSRKSPPCCAGDMCRPRCTARTCCQRRRIQRRNHCRGLAAFAARYLPDADIGPAQAWLAGNRTPARRGGETAGQTPARPPAGLLHRLPGAAGVLGAQAGAAGHGACAHCAADIGCHAFGTFEPFSMGHSILGYGMSLASRAGVSPMMQRRTLAVMGDGGFWHNGLLTGVQSALFNGDDAVLLIFKNGYTSATGTQEIISTPGEVAKGLASEKQQSLAHTNQTIESTLQGLGVQWMRTVHTYEVSEMRHVSRTPSPATSMA